MKQPIRTFLRSQDINSCLLVLYIVIEFGEFNGKKKNMKVDSHRIYIESNILLSDYIWAAQCCVIA